MNTALFNSCGQNVRIAPDAIIEHPECLEIGDNVEIMSGFHFFGCPKICRIGNDVRFYPNCVINGNCDRLVVDAHVTFLTGIHISLGGSGGFVEIGHNTHFAPYCVLYGGGGLLIGAYCNIAAHTVLATVGHDYSVKDRPMAETVKSGPIVLEEDIWIGANVTVTANTRIAKGCVIAANAVVTKDTMPQGIYAGVPARWIKER